MGNCYVDGNGGSDTLNDGKTTTTAWKTIQKATTLLGPGDTVNVKGGIVYTGSNACSTGASAVVCINTTNGSAGNYITYQPWPGFGTPILEVGASNVGFKPRKSYQKITGFEIRGQGDNGNVGFLITSSGTTFNIYSNNVIHGFSLNGGILNGSGLNNSYYNNTFYNNSGGALYAQNSDIVKNNIAYQNSGGGICINDAVNLAYNISYGNGGYDYCSTNGNNYSVDPLFVDYVNGILKLQKSSPAVNAGASISDVTSDFLGISRPQGSAFDIGAYEYYDIPVTLTTTPTTPSTNTAPTIAGTASTIGAATISSILYSVDSGSWVSTGVTGTSSFSIVVPALTDGSHTIRVRATDNYGNVSDSSLYGSTTFTIDTTAPTSNSVSINSGATYSTSIGVMLTLASTGATQMMVSENSGFSGASWETYSTSKSFTLSTGDGTKTVYVKFKDSVDNTSSSVSDTIILDTANPTLGSFVSPRDYTKDDNKPTLTFKKATDSTSDISSYSVSLDSGKYKNYSTSGILATGDTTKSSYIQKDDSYVKVEFFNENDSDSTNDEIKVYFKGLDSSELTEGKHSWKVTVTDKAGNDNSATQDFDLDRTSPSISELAIANVSTVKQDKVYTLSIFNRMPSFSGKVTDIYQGSEKTNTDGSKDTFDKISSGPDKLTLTLKKLKDKNRNTYENYLTQEYSLDSIIDTKDSDKSQRFYITTPYPLKDGNYQVTLTLKDKVSNTYTYPIFYLKIGNSTIFSPISSFVSDLFNSKKQDAKQEIIPVISPLPTNTATILNSGKQQPISPVQSFFSWVANLFKSIFHK